MTPSVPVVIRDARVDEHDTVLSLTMAAYEQYATIMEPTAWSLLQAAIIAALSVNTTAQRIVAERGGAIVGSVLLFPPSSDAYGSVGPRAKWPEIRLLAVSRDARGLGVARLLVKECLLRAKAGRSEAIGLHTSRSMREAIRLYETFGFQRDPAHDIRIEGAEPIDAYMLGLAD